MSTTTTARDDLFADPAVVRLLEAVRAPALDGELSGEAGALAAFRAVGPKPAAASRPRKATQWARVKIAVATVVGGLTMTTGLAAAGALPGAAQDFASDALAKVGITVPDDKPDKGKPGTADEPAPANVEEQPPPADNHGAEVSDTARTTDAEGREKGAEVSGVASDGKSRAGEEHGGGKPEDTPAAKPAPAPARPEPPAKAKKP